MAHPKAAWGIEVGANAIKALRLERDGDGVTVSDFAVVPHKKVLTTPDMDQDEMIRLSLGQFISQKSLEGEHLVMSVPGHAAFVQIDRTAASGTRCLHPSVPFPVKLTPRGFERISLRGRHTPCHRFFRKARDRGPPFGHRRHHHAARRRYCTCRRPQHISHYIS